MPKPGSTRLLQRFPAFSYHKDDRVPDFPEDRPLIVFDGVCVFCSGFIQFVVKRDSAKPFYLTTAQSRLGQALYCHYGLDDQDFETNLLIKDGKAYGKLESFVEIVNQFGGIWKAAAAFFILPPPVRDWLYDRVALNRYRLFGRHEKCIVPPPDWNERFLQ